jgi:hypothetical protein
MKGRSSAGTKKTRQTRRDPWETPRILAIEAVGTALSDCVDGTIAGTRPGTCGGGSLRVNTCTGGGDGYATGTGCSTGVTPAGPGTSFDCKNGRDTGDNPCPAGQSVYNQDNCANGGNRNI